MIISHFNPIVFLKNVSGRIAKKQPMQKMQNEVADVFEKTVEKMVLPKTLKNANGEFYKITIFNKIDQKFEDAIIGYQKPVKPFGFIPEGEKALFVYDLNGEKIGGVDINFLDWQTEAATDFTNGLPKPYLRLHYLESENNKKYSGVGSRLIQAAVERSIAVDSNGRIYLYSSNCSNTKNDPFVFYNKMGLSLSDPNGIDPKGMGVYSRKAAYELGMSEDKFINQLEEFKGKPLKEMKIDERVLSIYETVSKIANTKLDKIRLDFGSYMYLHDDNVEKIWIPKIKANPIFAESNKLK